MGPQAEDQLTPLLEMSPVTITAMGAEAPASMAFGGWVLKERAILGVLRAMVAEADLVPSATEVAVTVTELLVAEKRAEGAV